MVIHGSYPHRTFSRLHNLHKPRVPHHCCCLFLTLHALHHPHPLLPSFLTVHTQNFQHSSFLYYLFLFYPISIFHTAGPIFYFTLPQLLILYTAHFPLLSFLTPHFYSLCSYVYTSSPWAPVYTLFHIVYALCQFALCHPKLHTFIFHASHIPNFLYPLVVCPHSTLYIPRFPQKQGCVCWVGGGGLNFDPKGNEFYVTLITA